LILNQRTSIIQSRIGQQNASIQQIKTAGVTSRTTNSQGLPKIVSNVSVSITKSGTSRTLRVSFTQNPNDPYFTNGQLYIKQGTGNPTLLASGTSPIIVTLPKSVAPAVVTVVSSGNWGSTPVSRSPGKAVSLG
jgi:hypothetical protein